MHIKLVQDNTSKYYHDGKIKIQHGTISRVSKWCLGTRSGYGTISRVSKSRTGTRSRHSTITRVSKDYGGT